MQNNVNVIKIQTNFISNVRASQLVLILRDRPKIIYFGSNKVKSYVYYFILFIIEIIMDRSLNIVKDIKIVTTRRILYRREFFTNTKITKTNAGKTL